MAEKLQTQTIRLTDEQLKKLDQVAKEVYREASRNRAVQLLIEDKWKEQESDANTKAVE